MSLITNKNIEIEHIGWLDIFDSSPQLKYIGGFWPGAENLEGYGAMSMKDLLPQHTKEIIQTCFPENQTVPLLKEALYILTHMGEYDCTPFQQQKGKRKSDNFKVKPYSIELASSLIDEINDRISVSGLYDPDWVWKIRVSNVSFMVIFPGKLCIGVTIQQYTERLYKSETIQQYTERPSDCFPINVVGDACTMMNPKDDNIYFESLKNMANFEEL